MREPPFFHPNPPLDSFTLMLSNSSLRSYLLRYVVVCAIVSIPTITVAYLNGLPHITFAWFLVSCEVMVHHMAT